MSEFQPPAEAGSAVFWKGGSGYFTARKIMKRDKLYKGVLAAAGLAAVILLGVNTMQSDGGNEKYGREASRATIKLAETEFIQNLKHGNSLVDQYLGGTWMPVPMPINEKYQGLLKEKIVFLKDSEQMNNYSELVVMDTYTAEAFPNISTYLKHHARELEKKNPDGRIKILHDGEKGIIYQWAIIKDGTTKYLEFGKVEMTDEGLLSVKYINKGTEDLEHKRQCAIKLFTKV